jgi:hypothetical protein
MEQMPLFTRTFDFLAWLMPVTNRFPRSQRFLVTKRLLDAGLDFEEAVVCANHQRGAKRLRTLARADELLDRVRLYLRLAERWQWLDGGQYHHAAAMVSEMGRLLGGWKQSERR